MTQIEAQKGVDYVVLADNLSPEDVGFVEEEPPHSRIGQYILGGCVAVIVAAIATSVFAQENTHEFYPGTIVSAFPADVGFVVELENAMSPILSSGPFSLSVEGQQITGHVVIQSGNVPNELFVVPPVGFYCDPCAVQIEEFDTGQVFLYPMGLS